MFCVAVPAMIGLSLYPASSRVFLWLLMSSLRSLLVMWTASPVVPRITRPLMPPLTRNSECFDCVSRSKGGDTGSNEAVPSLAKKVGTCWLMSEQIAESRFKPTYRNINASRRRGGHDRRMISRDLLGDCCYDLKRIVVRESNDRLTVIQLRM
jgi:hypothetical protein